MWPGHTRGSTRMNTFKQPKKLQSLHSTKENYFLVCFFPAYDGVSRGKRNWGDRTFYRAAKYLLVFKKMLICERNFQVLYPNECPKLMLLKNTYLYILITPGDVKAKEMQF
jgi:hypothetical protein